MSNYFYNHKALYVLRQQTLKENLKTLLITFSELLQKYNVLSSYRMYTNSYYTIEVKKDEEYKFLDFNGDFSYQLFLEGLIEARIKYSDTKQGFNFWRELNSEWTMQLYDYYHINDLL